LREYLPYVPRAYIFILAMIQKACLKLRDRRESILLPTGAEVWSQSLVGFRRPTKNQWLTTHLFKGIGEAQHSRPRETAYTSTPSNAQKIPLMTLMPFTKEP